MKCGRCGYSLDGLAREGLCPECGLAVLRSMQGGWREPESNASRYVHTVVAVFLSGALVAHMLHPQLRWYYGPTEYDNRVALVGLLAAFIGVVACLVDFLARAWGPRMVFIGFLTLALFVPIYMDMSTTH